jgi:sugar O-acyltransferase (sialic acid O-acetyltransferase NeuD family)
VVAGGWVLYCCRTPYSVEVAEVIWRCGDEVALLVESNFQGVEKTEEQAGGWAAEIGAPVSRPDVLTAAHRELPAVVPLITPGHRHAVEAEARTHGLQRFSKLIDPTAVIARTATVGEGTVVNADAVVAAGSALGAFVQVNRSASVGHHNVIEDYSTLGPGCLLAGEVRIGRGAFVGAGAVCAPRVTIGPNAVIGAGAVVIRDVSAGAIAVGNPASVVREDEAGYEGVAVPA